MSACQSGHPDPSTVPFLFCRTCGYFELGARVGEATDDRLIHLFGLVAACKCECHKLESVLPCQLCVHRHSGALYVDEFAAHAEKCERCQIDAGKLCKEGDSILRTGFPF